MRRRFALGLTVRVEPLRLSHVLCGGSESSTCDGRTMRRWWGRWARWDSA